MARRFVASGSDKLTLGSPAPVTNLSRDGGLTVIVVGQRRSDTNNLFVASKTSAIATRGWAFVLEQNVAVFGRPQVIIGGASLWNKVALDADAWPLNEHRIGAFTFNGSAVTIYGSALQIPITEVSGYAVNTVGATAGTDSTDPYHAWADSTGGSGAFGGDGAWQIVFNRVLSLAEIQDVQQGVLAYAAGDTTRGINMMKSVSGYVLLNYLAFDGTDTEYSATTVTPSLTGTTAGAEYNQDTAGASLNLVKSLTAWEDDNEPNAPTDVREQTTSRYTSAHARIGFTGAFTSVRTWIRSSLDRTYANQAVVGVVVDGNYHDTHNTGQLGLSSDITTGMSGSQKTLYLVNGVRSRPDGLALPYQGTWAVLAIFDAAATAIAVPARRSLVRLLTDSILNGFMANPPQERAALQQLRRKLPSYFDGISHEGYGGAQLYDFAVDAATRATTITMLTADNPKWIVINLGINDWGREDWSAASFETGYTALLQALLWRFTGRVLVMDIFDTASSGTNALGSTIANYRTAVANAVAASNRDNRIVLWQVQLLFANSQFTDGTHPDNEENDTLYPLIAEKLETPAKLFRPIVHSQRMAV